MSTTQKTDEKYALVTGASGSIGQAIVEMLLKDGWQVYGTGRREELPPLDESFVSSRFHYSELSFKNPRNRPRGMSARGLTIVRTQRGLCLSALCASLSSISLFRVSQFSAFKSERLL